MSSPFIHTIEYLKSQPRVSEILEAEGGKLLLHGCCGPCAEAPILDLMEAGLCPSLYYYNPNIFPKEEWQRRREAIEQLARLRNLDLLVEEGDREKLKLGLPNLPQKCFVCYQQRLFQAAKRAKELGYKVFSTSLLVSPYQNREQLIKLGCQAAAENGLDFLAIDWRPIFRLGQNLAKEHGLYRQRFCACYYSLSQSKWKDQILADLDKLQIPNETRAFASN